MDENLTGSALTRRKFLCVTSATLVATPFFQLLPVSGGSWRFFSGDEPRIINALCERIIPSDQDPGASWAGVVQFIDRKLDGYHRRHQTLYRRGIQGLEQSSAALFGKSFTALTAEQQDDLLRKLESNQAPGDIWQQASAPEFFNIVIEHTLQGFYGGPRHGGNKDAVSWLMLGLPTPILRSRRPVEAVWHKPPASASEH